MKQIAVDPDDLVLVSRAPEPDASPLQVGDKCRLNSGGGKLLVVDCCEVSVVVSYSDGFRSYEFSLPRACVRRCEVSL